jgi:hypothetical protein
MLLSNILADPNCALKKLTPVDATFSSHPMPVYHFKRGNAVD